MKKIAFEPRLTPSKRRKSNEFVKAAGGVKNAGMWKKGSPKNRHYEWVGLHASAMSESAWEAYSSNGDVGLVNYDSQRNALLSKGDYVQVYLDRLRDIALDFDVQTSCF